MNKGAGGHQEVISNCSKWKYRSITLPSFVRDLRPGLPRLAETDGHRLFAPLPLPACATLAGFQRAEFVFVHDLSDFAHAFGRRPRLRAGFSGGALFRFRHIVSSSRSVTHRRDSLADVFGHTPFVPKCRQERDEFQTISAGSVRRPTIGCFAVCGLRRLENACTSLGTSCQRTHRLPEPAGDRSGCAAVEASLAIPSLHDSHPVVHENRQGSSDGPRIAARYSEARHLGAL